MSAGGADSSYRSIKHHRSACRACRRKKVRCSGEQPTCALCRRLAQECTYSEDTPTRPVQLSSELNPDLAPLRSRVMALETQLQCLTGNKRKPESHLGLNFDPDHNRPLSHMSTAQGNHKEQTFPQPQAAGEDERNNASRRISPYFPLPPAVVRDLTDCYFLYCHNQPYCLFQETRFRERLEGGLIPRYLALVFLGSAMQFCQCLHVEGRQAEIARACVRESWELLKMRFHDYCEENDISLVQALLLHSILDFTEGKNRRAWIKVGITVRICQDLRLMLEPDPKLHPVDQEERRRVFWSAYILDKFASCGQLKPSGISDEDCRLQLPCGEICFRRGLSCKAQTLEEMRNDVSSAEGGPSAFACFVFMVSILGRCAKYILYDPMHPAQVLPWNAASQYAAIDSTLLFAELKLFLHSTLNELIARDYTMDGIVDQQRAVHLVLAHVVCNLCHCLLNHPLLLCVKADLVNGRTPTSFLRRAFQSCREHAVSLVLTLRDAPAPKSPTMTSIKTYCAIVASTVHALYVYSENELVRNESTALIGDTLEYLEQLSIHSLNVGPVKSSLQQFQAESARYSTLIRPPFRVERNDVAHVDRLFGLLDYGVLCTLLLPLNINHEEGNRENQFDGWGPNCSWNPGRHQSSHQPHLAGSSDYHAMPIAETAVNANSTDKSLDMAASLLTSHAGDSGIAPPVSHDDLSPLSQFLLSQSGS